jgi:hypothetical protein
MNFSLANDSEQNIASFNFETGYQHPLYGDRPGGWEYAGSFPYLASWADNLGNSGNRSLQIKDDDKGSYGLWCSPRIALPDKLDKIKFSFALKTNDLKGDWKIDICYYDIAAEHYYSKVKLKIKGIINKGERCLSINWYSVDNKRSEQLFNQKISDIEKNEKGFRLIKAEIPVFKQAKCFRIAFISGWNPVNTGTVWLDDVQLMGIQ